MNKPSRDQLFRLIEDANRFERDERKRVHPSAWKALVVGLGLLAGLIVLSFVFHRCFGISGALRDWGLVVAGLLILLLFYPQQIIELIRNPTVIYLRNAKITANTDAKYLPDIMEQHLDDIEFVRLEVSTERDNLQRRMSLLIGTTIEKIGVAAALLALYASLQVLQLAPSQAYLLFFALCTWFLFGFLAQGHLMFLDRMLKLLDLAAVRRKAELESPPNGAP